MEKDSAGNDTKEIFRKCGSCSQTFAYLINREYEHRDPIYEKALDTLAGGIFREGHQCGMLWGAALATGAEAYRRTDNVHEAEAMALSAAAALVNSFKNEQHTIACREITGVRLNRLTGLTKFMLETLLKGIDNSKCFVIAEEWTPLATEAGESGLNHVYHGTAPTHNCAALMARQLGGTEQEAAMVAGFAGGLGLSGQGCGALAVALWMKTLAWLREHPGKTAPMFRFPEISKIVKGFKQQTDNVMKCVDICNTHFSSAEEHSHYIENGGCHDLMMHLQVLSAPNDPEAS